MKKQMAPTPLSSFEGIFATLVADIKNECIKQYELPAQVWKWFEKVWLHISYPASNPVPLSFLHVHQCEHLVAEAAFETSWFPSL